MLRYRFRTMVERPDWDPAAAILVEIAYDATEAEVDYHDDSSSGGITECEWTIVRLWNPHGQTTAPDRLQRAGELLREDVTFGNWVQDVALQDFAQRESVP